MRKRKSKQCPKIDENKCRINTIHLTEGEVGVVVRTILVRRLHWTRKETFWNIFANGVFRCHLGSGVSQMLLCYQHPSYWGGGGGSAHFNSRFFFAETSAKFFSFISVHCHYSGVGYVLSWEFSEESKQLLWLVSMMFQKCEKVW